MTSLKKERLSVQVYNVLRKIIETEHFKPGDKFYSEHQLSKRLEVSRSSIREAVRMLEVSGLVTVAQGRGVFLKEQTENDLPIRGWAVDNADSLREHFQVRLMIEPEAAALSAVHAADDDLEAMREAFSLFRLSVEHKDIEQAISQDGMFHTLISKSTQNRTLSVLMETMAQTLNEGWFASLNIPGRLERTVAEHQEILDALLAHDAGAAKRAMKQHLKQALKDIETYTKSF
jgi:GntR family transcriptional repressor for pyruvate dehydrogenase complex